MEIDQSPVTFHIVLYQPEIPANTGNIGRLCVGAGARLHLVRPIRFLLTDKQLKRAGLDYWQELKPTIHDSLEDALKTLPEGNVYYCTTKSICHYTARQYRQGDIFVFGPESRGLPEDLLRQNEPCTVRIPMTDRIRSINLANSVGIVLYEAWRQIGFTGVSGGTL